MTLAGAPAVRTSKTRPPTRVCVYGTYIVGGAGVAHAVVLDIAQHADDLELRRCLDAGAEPLADRILVREVLLAPPPR